MSLSHYEKKSLYRFLALYLGSAFFLLSLTAGIGYKLLSDHLVEQKKIQMQSEAFKLVSALVDAHMQGEAYKGSLSSSLFETAMFDREGNMIHGNIRLPEKLRENFSEIENVWYLKDQNARGHMGVETIILKDKRLTQELAMLRMKVSLWFCAALLFILLIAIGLGKLFLKPIREYVEKIDRFAKESAHELSTPLSALMMSVSALSKDIPDPNRHLQRIQIASRKMVAIQDDLQYWLLQEHRNKELEKVNMGDLIRERAEFHEPLAKLGGLDVICLSDTPLFLEIDRFDAQKLVDNLLSNAIKYTLSGGVIKISIEKTKIIFEDSGIGISEKDKMKIFERYARAENVQGGYGIGLAIVKSICDFYGISIDLESEPGKGSRFILDCTMSTRF